MSRSIVFLSASPRPDSETASGTYLSMLGSRIRADQAQKATIDVRRSLAGGRTDQDFKALAQADSIVIAFPLYFFCLPGMLMRFLEDYHRFYLEAEKPAQKQKVYAIVNCGFPEAGINEEAVRVIKSFSDYIGADFRFGIQIGGGGMIIGTKDAPFMKKTIAELDRAMDELVKDIFWDGRAPCENFFITPNFPRRLYFFMGTNGFIHSGRKNGLRKKDLYRKPYRPGENG